MRREGGLFGFADGVDKLLMFFGTLGCIGDGLGSPLQLFILSGMVDSYGSADGFFSNEVVDKYSLRMIYVAIGVGVSAFIESVCWTRTSERQTSRMRTEYLKSVLRQEVGFFDTQAASTIIFQVISTISTDAHLIQDVIAEKIPTTLAHLSTFIFSIVVALLLSWRLGLSSLPFVLLFVVPALGIRKVMQGLGMRVKGAYEVGGGVAEQAISSVRTVYSYVGEHQTLESYSHALQQSMELGLKLGFTKGLLIGSMGMVYVTWSFISWAGSIFVTEKGESGGRVFVSGICVMMVGMSCISAVPNVSFIFEATTASKRIFEMIARVPRIDPEDANGETLESVRGDIEFKEVHFSYPSRPDTPILQGLNLKVKAGTTVGLVGGSGSGKSTVISLLERFYDPVTGDILLDGHEIKKLQLKWLRSQMGLVNQEPVLFATSIKENILFGKDGASMELVETAAMAANAHDFILKLPHGYDTQVGQFGVQLSGGQKQRIAIARALLKEPKILLLDEATSALDAQSERMVQEALDQASVGRTTIIIAHRLTTIRNADQIVVLRSGEVVESGSHDDLMQINDGQGSTYSKMIHLQQTVAENETFDSPYSPIAGRKSKDQAATSPRTSDITADSIRSSAHNSSDYPLSPVIPFSMAQSGEHHSCYDGEDKNLDDVSNSGPSQWRLLQMNEPEWKTAVIGCLGAASFGAIQTAYAYCLGSVVSIFFLKDGSKLRLETRYYSIIFFSIGVCSFITNLLQHYNFAVMGEHLVKRVREKLLENVLTFEIGWFDQEENTSAAVCARLAKEANMVRSLVGDRISLLLQVFICTTLSFVLGLIISWRVALVVIAIQPFVIMSFYSKIVVLKNMSTMAQTAQNEGSQLASEAVVNHRTITAFSSQERIMGIFAATLEGPKKEWVKQSWFSGVGFLSSQFISSASIALTFWYGGRLINQGLLSSNQLFKVYFILMTTGKTIADAGSMTSDLSKGSSAIGSIFAIIDRKSEINPNDPEGVKITKRIIGLIELKSISFYYPSRPEQMIFQGLNLKIEEGTTMALVGQSGSGKSTIIGLVERFYDPIKGSVLIYELDIKSYNLRELRSHIALVSQEPTLFAGSIHDNIIYGKEEATESEIRRAAELANAHEFISSMKDGYDTFCGERGVQLSGGQKQRIALARAILKNPSILLLDEATSALDSESESLVQEALEKMMVGRTCVVVAHRLSTIQKSDCIAVIENGKVVEKGSHSELLSIGNNGSYYSLMKFQRGLSAYQ